MQQCIQTALDVRAMTSMGLLADFPSNDPPDKADFGVLCHVGTPPLEALGGVGVPRDEVAHLHVPELIHEALDGLVKLLHDPRDKCNYFSNCIPFTLGKSQIITTRSLGSD